VDLFIVKKSIKLGFKIECLGNFLSSSLHWRAAGPDTDMLAH